MGVTEELSVASLQHDVIERHLQEGGVSGGRERDACVPRQWLQLGDVIKLVRVADFSLIVETASWYDLNAKPTVYKQSPSNHSNQHRKARFVRHESVQQSQPVSPQHKFIKMDGHAELHNA